MFRTICAFVLSFSFAASAEERLVILIPFDERDTEDRLLAMHPEGNFWHQLKEACAESGYSLTTTRDHDPGEVFAVVAFNAPSEGIVERYAPAKKVLFAWEPPCIHSSNFNFSVHAEYDRVLTWYDDLVDGEKYRKFNYALEFGFPEEVVPFHEKKLCSMFVGNNASTYPNELYSERLEMIQFLEGHAPQNFDFYGSGWSSFHVSYRGYAPNKVASMKYYKFVIVYENTKNIPGYITEKIFDAFSAGCVPVYWGASNVSQHIPENAFIAREDFKNNAQLYAFLENMSEERYNEYLAHIQTFLGSEQAQLFSCEHFIATFLDALGF